MQTIDAAQKAPRASKPNPEPKREELDRSRRDDEREPPHDDDLYGNLAHTD